ncbi:MAG: hypothetical protein ACXAC2_00200 [Candidatus Kariarchaeaceae archaeon]|jgi:hypothetical protein
MVLETVKNIHTGKVHLKLTGITADDEKSDIIDLWAIAEYPQIAKIATYVQRTAGATNTISISLEFSMKGGADFDPIASESITETDVTGGESAVIITADRIGRFCRIFCTTVGAANTLDYHALIA